MTDPDRWITVPEAAAMLGVTRQRVLQAIHPDYAVRKTDELLAHKDVAPEGASRRRLLVKLAEVIAWRTRRALADEPVGPLPDEYADAQDFPPPVPELPAFHGIGIPGFRPF